VALWRSHRSYLTFFAANRHVARVSRSPALSRPKVLSPTHNTSPATHNTSPATHNTSPATHTTTNILGAQALSRLLMASCSLTNTRTTYKRCKSPGRQLTRQHRSCLLLWSGWLSTRGNVCHFSPGIGTCEPPRAFTTQLCLFGSSIHPLHQGFRRSPSTQSSRTG